MFEIFTVTVPYALPALFSLEVPVPNGFLFLLPSGLETVPSGLFSGSCFSRDVSYYPIFCTIFAISTGNLFVLHLCDYACCINCSLCPPTRLGG